SRGAAALELHGAERSHRQGDGAGRGDEGELIAGVARVAGRDVPESPDLRARRERDLGDAAAARYDRPHARLARPDRCLWWQLHVPTRAQPDSTWTGSGARLPRRRTRYPRAAPADEAAPDVPARARGRRDGRVGCQSHPRGGVLLAAGASVGRWGREPGRAGRFRGRAVAQGNPLQIGRASCRGRGWMWG